jgi:imidazolonepropionase-like amidohydrolase
MTSFIFHGGRLLNPRLDTLVDGFEVLVEGGYVKEVCDREIRAADAIRIDLDGRTLMPGLIDAHVHIFITEVKLALLESIPLTLLAVQASHLMRAMLMRGFTTVRDTAGGDWGMKVASDTGLVDGPRLFICGQAISQTGGHGDFRRRTHDVVGCPCCSALPYLSRIVDGVPEMLKAVRDELRKGADHIKLMVSGGVASPHDPLESLQFRTDEIEAACQEAYNWGRYVCAHAYTAEAVRRAVAAGVRTIEHGNLIDASAAAMMAERGAFLVPTLVTYDAMHRRGSEFGLPEESRRKNVVVREAGLRSLELARSAGVQIGFGSDLLGQMQVDQSREFLIRREGAERPIEIIRAATLVNARILGREGNPDKETPDALGELLPGACADLLVIDGDPTLDLELLQDQGAHMPVIMKGGKFFKNLLTSAGRLS